MKKFQLFEIVAVLSAINLVGLSTEGKITIAKNISALKKECRELEELRDNLRGDIEAITGLFSEPAEVEIIKLSEADKNNLIEGFSGNAGALASLLEVL